MKRHVLVKTSPVFSIHFDNKIFFGFVTMNRCTTIKYFRYLTIDIILLQMTLGQLGYSCNIVCHEEALEDERLYNFSFIIDGSSKICTDNQQWG